MSTKIQMNRILCVPDRACNKADDMHLRASIKSRIDKGLKPLLQTIALKVLEGNPDYDYVVEDGRRRFLALADLKFTEIELGQEAILIDGDSEINAYLANQHTNLSLAEEIAKLCGKTVEPAESFRTVAKGNGSQNIRLYDHCPL